ncbi:Ubiquitin carboxyl-terminal hydrolase [Trichinella pseudospiralis]
MTTSPLGIDPFRQCLSDHFHANTDIGQDFPPFWDCSNPIPRIHCPPGKMLASPPCSRTPTLLYTVRELCRKSN